ncbi:bifunctional folylpolyglutamate synthase/dihydrofolate synthase [Cohnella endophytica]|uniref:Dihydrofolate synthase/folylpolyglutamate synthase n=1 Tax=Cohnella endophytica TaxID=2419778 RepID=A0A494Y2X1_9BACL|nr:folylpolyglutamate synthase/dihydrofolate synthase family protein [Cohnella endophytica]RKP54236.1 bifunctional folylpolyglutamate synthase/dihydrofolate synthase [Cohnella endophytica]
MTEELGMNEGSSRVDSFRTAEEALAWIMSLTSFGIRPGLERITRLMETLGNPQRRLKFIHVAGTNGKGSVCAYLTSVIRQSGYDVGTFTSPYLTSFSNRLQYNGQDIEDEILVRLVNVLKPEAEKMALTEWGSPTIFEVTTALALLYYGTVAYPDYVVWETGLGGRLDVTNIVTPVVSVITNVGHDHMDILGPTIADIAREKAGIIKAGVPVITAVKQPETIEIIKDTARSCQSTVYRLGDAFSFETLSVAENEQKFSFQGPFRALQSLTVTLNGAHQLENAATAIMTLEVLRQYYALIVEDEDLVIGLRNAKWPGRLEMVSENPRVLIDGAHNPEGMEALSNALKDVYKFDRLNVMMAMMPNKNHEHSLRHILPMVDTLVITEPDFHKKMNAADLAVVANRLREELGRPRNIIVEPNWRRALELLQEADAASPEDEDTLNVITGTLYLIADVRSWLLDGTKSEKGW